MLDPDRLFPADPGLRALARDLHEGVRSLPILSSHGHTDPRWFAGVQPFAGPAEQLVIPDHHVFRMLCSRGIALENRGIPRLDGGAVETGTRAFCAIPARYEVAWRVDCGYLATLVDTGRLDVQEAPEVARDLAHGSAKSACKLQRRAPYD